MKLLLRDPYEGVKQGYRHQGVITMIRILIGLSQGNLLEDLKIALNAEEDMIVLETAENGPSLLRKMDALHPDVVLLDVIFPDINGIPCTRHIKEKDPRAHVILLSAFPDDSRIAETFCDGASCYLLKDAILEECVLAIREVWKNGVYISPMASRKLIEGYVRAVRGKRTSSPLTPKQQEVLRLMAGGACDHRIANDLGVSPSTIRVHRKDMMERLGVRTRESLMEYAEMLNP